MATANKQLRQSFRKQDVASVQRAFAAGANADLGELHGRGLFKEALEHSSPEMQKTFVEAFIADITKSKKLDLNYLGTIFDTLREEKFSLAKQLLEGLQHAEDLRSAFHLLPIKLKSLEGKGSEVGADLVAKALVNLHMRDANTLRKEATLLSQEQDTFIENTEEKDWIRPSLSKIFMRAKNRKLARAIENEDLAGIERSLKEGTTPLTFNAMIFTPSLLERALYSSPPDVRQKLAKFCADQRRVTTGYFTALHCAAKKDIECLSILLEGVKNSENSEEAFLYMSGDVQEAKKEGRYKAAVMMATTLANIHDAHAEELSRRPSPPATDATLNL